MSIWAAITVLLAADAVGDGHRPAPAPLQLADLQVTIGKSIVVDYPTDVARISTSDPTVADAVPATLREFLVHGKGHGSATIVVWAKNGQRTLYNVVVEHNTEPIRQLLKDTFPQEQIDVKSARDEVTLVGRVSSKEVADRAVAVATPLAKTVVNSLQIAAPPVSKQIVLRVKFAELNRSVGKSFAVNLVPLGALNTYGRITTGQFSPPALAFDEGGPKVTISDALNIFMFRPDLELMAFVRVLQQQGVLQILAEPNLVTTPGKEASFLAGGEFPVPVIQGGANVGAVTIMFREFGVRLTFNPQITEHGTIKMYVKPEVSTIDVANAVTVSGFTIPALSTRRVETNIELAEGQSFVIGGLIDDRVTANMARIPGLGDIPILGQIFRSKAENKTKTELIVLVSPEIANPIPAGSPLPDLGFPKTFLPAAVPAGPTRGDASTSKKKPVRAGASKTGWPEKDRLQVSAKDSGVSAAAIATGGR